MTSLGIQGLMVLAVFCKRVPYRYTLYCYQKMDVCIKKAREGNVERACKNVKKGGLCFSEHIPDAHVLSDCMEEELRLKKGRKK